jgi:uncharacterized membrane protein YphA (DoxX/SURF4 family)
MKTAITIVRVLVGLLFIFSGLVKAIDPLGLSYKMQEFFEIWNMSQFNSVTLPLSVLMNAFEIIAGFALLLGWRIRLFIWLLLLLIVFFTFLTGYAYYSDKFKNCGCFGDCIPITPLVSFGKDIVLTVMIVFLFLYRDKIKPLFSSKMTTTIMFVVAVFGFGLQWYSLTYLPPVDCLPYKKGKNITEQMKMPAHAIPDSTVITFVYEKNGEKVEFTADKFPEDFSADTYRFISRYDKVVKKGKNNVPPVTGFALSGITGEDSTSVVLSQPYVFLIVAENFSVPVSRWKNDFEKLYSAAKTKNIPCFLVTSRIKDAPAQLAGTGFSDIRVFSCDFTAIRTAARTNPTLYLLNEGTILGKWSRQQTGKAMAELEKIPAQELILPESEIMEPDSTNHQ